MRKRPSIAIFFFLLAAILQNNSFSETRTTVLWVRKESDGVTIKLESGALELKVYSSTVVRVIYSPSSDSRPAESMDVVARPSMTRWTLNETPKGFRLITAMIEVRVNRLTGAVSFYDRRGDLLLAEGERSLSPNRIGSLSTLRSRQDFSLADGDAIFGLGQHQSGLMNYRGTTVHLQQRNMEVAVPVLVSSRGYGLLWDNPAVTDVDVGSDGKQTASTDREDDRSKAGSTAMTRQEGPAGPSSFEGNGQVGSTPKAASSTLTFSSESAESIDYYFMYGPEPDQIISSYRKLTGEAPMFGRWAFGFWQCKERYKSEQELMDVVGEYRNRNIPIDGIIQDWRYWTPALWGSHEFDPKRYPDPVKMIRDLHAENTHILISVWPKFDPKSDNAAELRRVNGLYPQIITYMGDGQWVDTFNPEARRVYWQQISRKLFSKGIDGFWLDGSEPELNAKTGEYRDFTTAAGPGFKVNNAYPLMLTRAVYEGQRSETSEKRVFILTRSAYAGQQRYGAVTWSGDIKGTWDVFAKQIPAGVNFSLSGIPYWNTDTGGFDTDEGPKSPAYRELFTRWFEFSAFCPMFRVHGTGDPKEIWRFDDATQKILVSYDELRYHLMPYIYSTSWKVTHEGYTMMRGLVMDFRGDPKVYDITDQYLFGPGIMVSPVVKAGAATREVYLPGGTKWIDFWSGKTFEGGQTIEAQVPIETEPLLVRAGSIIPYGPPIQYAAEKSDPIELRVYRGASGNFTLYEDEGDSYDYEKGVYSTIPISWNEATHKLTIGARKGSFPGMQANRTFRIVWVRPNHGTGIPNTETSDAVVNYNGKAVTISARE